MRCDACNGEISNIKIAFMTKNSKIKCPSCGTFFRKKETIIDHLFSFIFVGLFIPLVLFVVDSLWLSLLLFFLVLFMAYQFNKENAVLVKVDSEIH